MPELSPKYDRNPTSLRNLASSIFRGGTPYYLFAFQLFARRATASPRASSDKNADTFQAHSSAPPKAKRRARRIERE